jgi:hypothetical protein
VRIQPPKVEETAEATEAALEEAKPSLTLPATAGEPDPDAPDDHDDDIGSLIKPAVGSVAKSDVEPTAGEPKQKHG